MLITNGNLEIVDPGIEYVIRTDKKLLDGLVFNLPNVFRPMTDIWRENRMDNWCTEHHGQVRFAVTCSYMSLYLSSSQV